ncbi:c-type cytochrome [Conexibacter sp. DBS9H8]|uniref:c-type cytochrome n=1 Tax=Conexibacter sp. DBS9H8 TaxID=2937801 RepID=UPI00200ED896|nr:c-type cytochrome [Conexibacter sp. DBS9H8]
MRSRRHHRRRFSAVARVLALVPLAGLLLCGLASGAHAGALPQGESLFDAHCASCHGYDLRGRRGVAPSLIGVGAGPVKFYLSTGRMPLANPQDEPVRETPIFDPSQIRSVAAYVRAIGGGPIAPTADPAAGSLSLGFKLFDENCAGCHSIVGRGGIAINAQVPDLGQATADEVAEAIRMGPYVMPHFSTAQLDQHDLNSIARYVLWTRHPDNAGGVGIYNIGPIPEGIVAWFVGLFALVIVARLIGERLA